MPFWGHFKWKDTVVWISPQHVDNIASIVKSHYNELSNAEFEQKQKKCRKVWENWLSLGGFCKNLEKLL
jgi:hypothetical protein